MQEFKVAKIINDYSLVINAGEKQGVKKDQKFQIIGKKGKEVKDPDTGEVIGQLDELKGIVFATTVYPNMTVVQSKIKSSPFYPDPLPALKSIQAAQHSMYTKQHEALNVDVSQITGGFSPEESSPIQVGDTAVMV